LSLLDAETFAKPSQLGFLDLPLHLNVVGAPMAPAGLAQAGLQGAVGGEDQQTFTVRVQPARGVNPGNGKDLGECAPAAVRLRGELAEDSIGLVQQNGLQDVSRRGGHSPLQ
jgi:hypothetical protein